MMKLLHNCWVSYKVSGHLFQNKSCSRQSLYFNILNNKPLILYNHALNFDLKFLIIFSTIKHVPWLKKQAHTCPIIFLFSVRVSVWGMSCLLVWISLKSAFRNSFKVLFYLFAIFFFLTLAGSWTRCQENS